MRRMQTGLLTAALLAGILSAQESAPGGWRRFGDPVQSPPVAGDPAPPPDSGSSQTNVAVPPPAYSRGWHEPQGQEPAPQGPVTFTVPAGAWVTVRVNQPLSTDHNQAGDAFTASLAEPIVVNGRVIARRGQMVGGRIVEVLKAGRVKGTSSMRVELTELGVADGQQVPIKTQMAQRNGGTSVGRDVAAVGTTTALGAAIGAGVDGGFGAGMGAIGGAVISGIGVLVTRGRPTVIYPETALTFRLENSVTVTGDAYAFAPAQQFDYSGGEDRPRPYVARPYPYAPYPYPYARYPRPYFYGPTVFFGYGHGWRRRW